MSIDAFGGRAGHLPSIAGIAGLMIDCGTPLLSLLAAKSFIESSPHTLLILDCSRDRSISEMAGRSGLPPERCVVVEWPLAKHGITLDRVVERLDCEFLYLLDSDAEIIDPTLPDRMLSDLVGNPNAYGAGMLHRAAPLAEAHLFPQGMAVYRERMWIPFVLLRSNLIRRAINDGSTFAQRTEYPGYLGKWSLLNTIVGRIRRLGLLRHSAGQDDRVVSEFDTGALLHEELLRRGHPFVETRGVAEGVIHLHGATRRALPSLARRTLALLGLDLPGNSTTIPDPDGYALDRLRGIYGCDPPGRVGECRRKT